MDWELLLGIYLIRKGFRSSPVLSEQRAVIVDAEVARQAA